MSIGNGSPGDFVVDNLAAMLGIRDAVVGSRCLRRDLNASAGGLLYTLTALPSSVEANWSVWNGLSYQWRNASLDSSPIWSAAMSSTLGKVGMGQDLLIPANVLRAGSLIRGFARFKRTGAAAGIAV